MSQQILQGKQESWILWILNFFIYFFFFFFLRSLAWWSASRNYGNFFFPMMSENVKIFWTSACSISANPVSSLSSYFFPILLLLLLPVFFMLFPSVTAMQDQFKPPSRRIHMKNSLFPKFFMFRSFKPFISSSINTSPLSPFSLFVHFVVVFSINEILIDSLWCFSCIKVFSSPEEPCWT